MLSVLALPRYGQLGASSRLRSIQYLPALAAAGVECRVSSLLDDQYLAGLYRGRVPWARVARAYVSRSRLVARSGRFDLVWTEKEMLPWLPSFLELGLLPRGVPLVVDCDDAIFHRYDQHRSALVRAALGRKIDRVMKRATLVIAGSRYLADRAAKAGADRVEVVPTVVDLGRYLPRASIEPSGKVLVGWIGSPSTAQYLHALSAPLARLKERHGIRCVAIGALPSQLEGTPFECWPWSEATEAGLLAKLDIGIMPLPDEPWERGKCGYKLIQYMATGLPVVASPVGANNDIVIDGENGFLACGDAQWEAQIKRLLVDVPLRRRMGRAGRALVERRFCLEVQGPVLAQLLTEVAGRSAG